MTAREISPGTGRRMIQGWQSAEWITFTRGLRALSRAVIARMELRWGQRFAQDTTAEITTAEGTRIPVSVKNASLSGAFLQTSAKLPLRACLSLRPQHDPEQRLDAKVVRVDDNGLALEWMGWPGMRSLSALLATRTMSR